MPWFLLLLLLLQGLGNLGLQNFHQRTLSAASSATAKITCFAAAFIVPTLGIPPILIGAVAASTGTELEMNNSRVNHLQPSLIPPAEFVKIQINFSVLLRLEPHLLRVAVPLRTRADGSHPAHRPAAPHAHLHLHRGHRGGGGRRHVLHRLGPAVRRLHLHLQHLQEHPEDSGEAKTFIYLRKSTTKQKKSRTATLNTTI